MSKNGDSKDKVLVIGGGIAGITATLDLANAGFKVYLVEKNPSLGGNMAKLAKIYPTNECSTSILKPLMIKVANHPNVELLTYSEIESVEGTVGNFKVKVRKKQTWVDWEKCLGCGACLGACPPKAKAPDEFNEGLGFRGAIYIPFLYAIPHKAIIDVNVCAFCAGRKFGTEPRRKKTGEPILAPCERACPVGATDRTRPRDPNGEVVELNVGAIIIATGYRLKDKKQFKEYAPDSPNVITALQMERLISTTGPTEGELIIPADIPKYLDWKRKIKKGGKAELNVRKPNVVTFISCIRSKDDRSYPLCCMYTLKQAMVVKEKYPNLDVYVIFPSIVEKYREYYMRCKELGVKILEGEVNEVQRLSDERLLVKGHDNEGKSIEIISDIIVLATAMEPNPDTIELARKLGIDVGEDGFLKERHPLYPVETVKEGIFICGCVQGPKDIPESIAQAKAAAASVISLLSPSRVEVEPLVSEVNPEKCSGCGICIVLCPCRAIEFVEQDGNVRAKINTAKCKGCGICVSACPSKAITLYGSKYEKIIAQIKSLACKCG